MKTKLEPDEVVIHEGTVGYHHGANHGTLRLTNRRLIWDRGFSITPLGQKHLSIPIGFIRGCRREGLFVVLQIDGAPETWFQVLGKWSTFFGASERAQEWLRLITDAMLENDRTKE